MGEKPRSIESLTDLELTTLIHKEDQARLRLFRHAHREEMAVMDQRSQTSFLLSHAKTIGIGPIGQEALSMLWARHMQQLEQYIDRLGYTFENGDELQGEVKEKLLAINEHGIRWVCSFRGGSFPGFVKTIAVTTKIDLIRRDRQWKKRARPLDARPSDDGQALKEPKATESSPLEDLIGQELAEQAPENRRFVNTRIDCLVRCGQMEPRGAWALHQRHFRNMTWIAITKEFNESYREVGGRVPRERQHIEYWAKKAGGVLKRDLIAAGINGSAQVAWEESPPDAGGSE